MREKEFIFTNEMGLALKTIREKANLFQEDVAKALGFKSKSAVSYISRLERGQIKNPSLKTIIMYLNACGGKRLSFFTELDKILIKQTHKEIMSEAVLTDEARKKRIGHKSLMQKLDRDTTLYANSIKYQKKPDKQINQELVKDKVERKVRMLLSDHKTSENLIPTYLDFTWHVLKRALTPGLNPPLDESPWIKVGIKKILFNAISHIVYETVKIEKKKLTRRKLPSSEKQKKMAKGFVKYRVAIEQVEFEVHKLLNDLQVAQVYFLGYKAFAREVYSILKRYYHKDSGLLSQSLAGISRGWKDSGLNKEVTDKVKETVIRVYKEILLKTIVK